MTKETWYVKEIAYKYGLTPLEVRALSKLLGVGKVFGVYKWNKKDIEKIEKIKEIK